MILARTAQAITVQVIEDAREAFRRALHDTGTSAAQLAASVGKSPTLVEEWSRTKHAPIYLIAHPRVPVALRVRLAGDALAYAAEHVANVVPIETGTALLVQIAAEALAAAGAALSDQRIDESERAGLRPLVARLRDRCDRWLREYSDKSVAGVSGR